VEVILILQNVMLLV